MDGEASAVTGIGAEPRISPADMGPGGGQESSDRLDLDVDIDNRSAVVPAAVLTQPEDLSLEGEAVEVPLQERGTILTRRVGEFLQRHMHLEILLVLYVASEFAFYRAGIRLDSSAIKPVHAYESQWQLLPLALLRHYLWTSLANLHSQPPLYNLAVGILLHLPAGSQAATVTITFLMLGAVMVVFTCQTMIELGVPRWVATVAVVVLVVANPENVLFQNWLSYAYPSAVFLAGLGYFTIRYLRRRTFGSGVALFAFAALEMLTDSTYQIEWLAFVTTVILLGVRGSKGAVRRTLLAGCVPLALCLLWIANDVARFGTFTTSSWIGMNLAKTTTDMSPAKQLQGLVSQHRLTSMALIPGFGDYSVYVPRYSAPPPKTSVAALDIRKKPDGSTNLDNLLYIKVSKLYLHNDIAYIEAEPKAYLNHVKDAVSLWFVPGDQYFQVEGNGQKIATYERRYDNYLLGQAQSDPLVVFLALMVPRDPIGPVWQQVSVTYVAIAILVLAGGPLVAWGWRRRDKAAMATLIVIWCTSVYAFVVTSLVELGENNRFRFELGTFPYVLGAVVLTEAVKWLVQLSKRLRRQPSSIEARDLGECDPQTYSDELLDQLGR